MDTYLFKTDDVWVTELSHNIQLFAENLKYLLISLTYNLN